MKKALAIMAAGALLFAAGCNRSVDGGSAGDGEEEVLYEGERITFLVPFAPGGVADVTARLVAESLPQFIPGEPTIVVQNLTGGGGSVAMQQLVADPADGMTMVMGNAAIILRHLLGEEGHDYPLEDIPAVGVIPSGIVTVTTAQSGDLEDLASSTEPILAGGVAAGGQAPTTEILAGRILGIPIRQVFGYEGYGPIALAIQRGEVAMASPGDTAYLESYADLAESGVINPQFQSGLIDADGDVARSPLIPDVPTVAEALEELGGEPPDEATADAFAAMVSLATLGTTLLTAPDTPPEYLDVLRAAFNEMGSSEEWQQGTAETLGAALPVLNANEAEPAYETIFGLPEGVIETIRGAAAEGGA